MRESMRGWGIMITVTLLFISGCTSIGGPVIASPAVTLTSVKLESANIRSQTFLLGIGINNPNPFPLPVKSMRYQVALDGEKFAGGETAANFTVPANGDGAFAIKVDLDLLRTSTQLATLLQSATTRDVNYALDGSLTADIPFAPPVPFATSGVIPLQR